MGKKEDIIPEQEHILDFDSPFLKNKKKTNNNVSADFWPKTKYHTAYCYHQDLSTIEL